MRMTQYIGLPHGADDFLLDNVAKKDASLCPHCGKPTTAVPDQWTHGHAAGMFDDKEIALQAYRLRDGRVVREIEQASPWSSGPMVFTMLVAEDGTTLFEWKDSEIEAAL